MIRLRRTIALTILLLCALVAQSRAQSTASYAPRFLDGFGHPLVGITVKLYLHGNPHTTLYLVASGTTDSNGYLVPSATLTIGATYDFVTNSPAAPVGSFVALATNVSLIPGYHRSILNLAGGFASGSLATTNLYPVQYLPHYSNGVITTVNVACITAGTATNIIEVDYAVGSGALSSIGTVTWTTGITATASLSAQTITAGDRVTVKVNAAGSTPPIGCAITLEGTQDLQ